MTHSEEHFLTVILSVIILTVVILIVVMLAFILMVYPHCRYAKCHFVECRGTIKKPFSLSPFKSLISSQKTNLQAGTRLITIHLLELTRLDCTVLIQVIFFIYLQNELTYRGILLS
jgi:hypothetical protein